MAPWSMQQSTESIVFGVMLFRQLRHVLILEGSGNSCGQFWQ
jgi:hypothetical protein